MSRITEKFNLLKKTGTTAFMPFVVAGYPDFETSVRITNVLTEYADLLEVGIPYSDPLADGPIIQEADQVALSSGMTPTKTFEFVRQIRRMSQIPITVLVYANIVQSFGVDDFYKRAKSAGVDGVLIPDAPPEEQEPYLAAAARYGIDPIFLVAQTSTNTRLKEIERAAKGFLYLVSILGVTGTKDTLPKETYAFLSRIKGHASLPAVVGFGVSTNAQIKQFRKMGLDGFIVGSFLVSAIKECSYGKNVKRFRAIVEDMVRI